MQKIRTGSDGFDDWGPQAVEDRKAFMAQNAHLYGDELQKTMEETMEQSRTQCHTATFEEKGKYHLVKGAEKLPRFKGDPVAFSKLMENSSKLTCRATGQEFVFVPECEFSQKKEEVNERAAKRTITQGATVRRRPAARSGHDGAGGAKGKAPPAGLVKKIDWALAKHNQSAYHLEQAIAWGSDERCKEH
eukprot:3468422-Pyramimonas_sp.AAC.1